MSRTLMILAHPKIEESIGNKTISELVNQHDNIEVRHLNKLYPDFIIDIEAEQQALMTADTIVFQYPLFWYSTPGILKEWIDQVFQYGFAFGGNSYKLEDKNVIVSFTIGSPAKNYPPEIIEKITFPFKGLAKYCKMNFINSIYCNDINNYTPGAAEQAKNIAEDHAEKLLALINS